MQIFFVIVGAVWTTAAVGGLALHMTKGALSEKHLIMLFVAMPAIAGVLITGFVAALTRIKRNEK